MPFKHIENIKLPESKSAQNIEINYKRRISISIKQNTIYINSGHNNIITNDLDKAKNFLQIQRERVPSSQIQIIADKNMKMKFLYRVIKIIRESAFAYKGFQYGSNIFYITK